MSEQTHADIIAKMRGADNKCQLATKDGTGCYHCPFGSAASNCVFNNYADRLEAAHKRELAVYVLAIAKLRGALVKCRDIALLWQVDEAAGVAGTTDKPHARSAAEAVVDMEFEINAALFTTATAEKLSAVGNAAKLREALEKIAHYADNRDAMDDPDCADGHILADIAKTALAAPPRNCDSYDSADEMMEKYADDAFLEEWKKWRETGKCHPLMLDAFLCINWLFLTNEKGETNGSK